MSKPVRDQDFEPSAGKGRDLPEPHGGRLVNRVLDEKERNKILASLGEFPKLVVSGEVAREIENIAKGVFSPLEGPMLRDDYVSVLQKGRLSNDLPWTIPIVVDVKEEAVHGITPGDDLLIESSKRAVALLHLEEVYPFDKGELAKSVFGTDDPHHPGVLKARSMNDLLLGGKIDLISEVASPFQSYNLPPAQTRALFIKKGWKTVVGFQTRNIPHLGHECLQKAALALMDGLFINPVVGRKKPGDFKDEVIIEAYRVLIDNYYPKDKVVLGILQTEMRYAGPKEAIFHAIARKNFGCTHFIVGRDHAGVGNFYSPFAAQEIFKDFPDLGIEPLFYPSFFYCHRCTFVVNEKTCPHGLEGRVEFSGTKIREFITNGHEFPSELVRPEVAESLKKWKDPFVK